jgi:hypothetical protein
MVSFENHLMRRGSSGLAQENIMQRCQARDKAGCARPSNSSHSWISCQTSSAIAMDEVNPGDSMP